MTDAFDKRIVRLGIEIDGEILTFDDLLIFATGRKYVGAIMQECQARIFNLTKEQRAYLLSNCSPLTVIKSDGNARERKAVPMFLEVGRESYGTFRLYQGDVFACGASQPPDIGIELQALANNFQATQSSAVSQSALVDLRTISQQTADRLGLVLDFQAENKNINNYSYTGSNMLPIEKLEKMGGIHVIVDGGKLIVIDSDKPIAGTPRLINMHNGMVGIPQVSSEGVVAKIMIDNSVELGQTVTIESEINPAANGDFKVMQMDFEVSNRETPFWYTLFCSSTKLFQGQ